MLFTTHFGLNTLAHSKQIFVDGTFKACPEEFYQLMVIHAFDNLSGLIIPCAFFFLTSKTYQIYYNTFSIFKLHLNQLEYQTQLENIHSDFEQNIFKAVFAVFGKVEHFGCWFHFVKALFEKLKEKQLYKRTNREFNKKLILILKYLPFIQSKKRIKFWSSYKTLFIQEILEKEVLVPHRHAYTAFLTYYEKNWLKFEQLWDKEDLKDKYFARTNNPAGIFNKRLNDLIITRPKFMITLDALRIIAIEANLSFEMRVSSPKKTSPKGNEQ